MGIWIGLWVATSVVGIILYVLAGPAIPGIGPKVDQLRKSILISGFFPCFGVNFVTSLIFFGMYKARTIGASQRSTAVNARLGQSGLSAPQPDPSKINKPSTDNPFL